MYSLTHLDDEALLRGFFSLLACDRRTTARLLAHIAEIDARHLYLRAGFESMQAYCVRELNLSTDAAAKRLQVARLARQLPVLFEAIADGRLHVKAVRLLAPRLNHSNVDELIEAAAGMTASEVEIMLANRYPQAEPLRFDDGIVPQVFVSQGVGENSHAPGHASFSPTASEVAPRVRTKIAPIAPERYTLQVTLHGSTCNKLRRAQELLGHAVPSGDVAEVLDRALELLVEKLERRKFGAKNPRRERPVATTRCITVRTRNAVNERDGGRCTALDLKGQRCNSTKNIEYDHIIPVALGGKSTVDNLRLVCRAHNQAAAEQVFGREFIDKKKRERRLAAEQDQSLLRPLAPEREPRPVDAGGQLGGAVEVDTV
jgi:5-methylcytosine-specific restriction endonuclease McrA